MFDLQSLRRWELHRFPKPDQMRQPWPKQCVVCDKKCENIAKIRGLLILFYRKYLNL